MSDKGVTMLKMVDGKQVRVRADEFKPLLDAIKKKVEGKDGKT